MLPITFMLPEGTLKLMWTPHTLTAPEEEPAEVLPTLTKRTQSFLKRLFKRLERNPDELCTEHYLTAKDGYIAGMRHQNDILEVHSKRVPDAVANELLRKGYLHTTSYRRRGVDFLTIGSVLRSSVVAIKSEAFESIDLPIAGLANSVRRS